MSNKSLNGVDTLRGLMNAYRDALKDGVPSSDWIGKVRVLLKTHGERLEVSPEDLVLQDEFITYVANMQDDMAYVRYRDIPANIILLALDQWQRDMAQYDENGRTYLEDLAYTEAEVYLDRTNYKDVCKLYTSLCEVVMNGHDTDRYKPFESLDELRRAIRRWIYDNKVINTGAH